MKIQNKKVINVSDWDDMVTKTYGRSYSFQQQSGCQERGTLELTVPAEAEDYENESVPEEVNGEEMGVSFAAWLKRDPKLPVNGEKEDWVIELWWHRNFYPDIQMVANDLHEKGLLKKGKYLIDIDW